MAAHSGLVLVLDEPRRQDEIRDRIEGLGRFTDVVSNPDNQARPVEVCLISLDSESFEYACLARRGQRVASAKNRVEFSKFVSFPPLSFSTVLKEVSTKAQERLRYDLRTGARSISPAAWEALWKAVFRLRPSVQDELSDLASLTSPSRVQLNRRGADTVAEEKDAVGIALDIFGLDRKPVLTSWLPEIGQEIAPFLTGLRTVRLPEDISITHDANLFGEWRQFARHITGAITFERPEQRLTIFNVNRTRVEAVLGVDLIYFHHTYTSYVAVQYKQMRHENRRRLYRPSDKSYASELARMRDISRYITNAPILGHSADYRLNSAAFYFKLCSRISLDMSSADLIPGMYLPLDYWETILEAPEVKGRLGGVAIGFDNVKRHITNSLFVSLVQDGWIGSRGLGTAHITAVVREAVDSGNSVTVALSSPG